MPYFIGINLEGESAEAVDKLRHSIAEKFSVRGALRLPPHLTLFYPFEIGEGGLEIVMRALAEIVRDVRSFPVKVDGFNHFDDRVWFLDVEQSERLLNLSKKLAEMMEVKFGISEDSKVGKGVHFHVTLAYKDVTPEKFKLIADYLSNRNPPIEKFDVDAITLFEKKAENWVAVRQFYFGVDAKSDA
jgi:2'-5' RNA ligase